VGRILERNKKVLRTDCTLVGGDSGGPLFDLEGRVVGIHSRIGPTLNMNFHVPVDTFDETWDRLEKAEVWGGAKSILNLFGGGGGNAFMGIQTEVRDGKIVVEVVVKDSPAEKAGVKKGDVLVKLGSTALSGGDDIPAQLKKKKVGDKVELEILRDGKTMKLEVTLGKRPE
jgi:serine protease Do